MRTKVKRSSPEVTLARIIDALAREAMEATDEELAEAAKGLRMDLNSHQSVAFAGVMHFAQPKISDFFDLEVPRSSLVSTEGLAYNSPVPPKDCKRHSKRQQIASETKRPRK
jgi:hypothetical protein